MANKIMPGEMTITVNGRSVSIATDTTVAAAIMIAGQACRTSVSGEARGPLCGMGICFECRATVDGVPHCRSCQILCAPGMDVRTDAK
jgi:aerobic-type carbon monoxide dehydrogenase small subunit (CoxS/CutS family)